MQNFPNNYSFVGKKNRKLKKTEQLEVEVKMAINDTLLGIRQKRDNILNCKYVSLFLDEWDKYPIINSE